MSGISSVHQRQRQRQPQWRPQWQPEQREHAFCALFMLLLCCGCSLTSAFVPSSLSSAKRQQQQQYEHQHRPLSRSNAAVPRSWTWSWTTTSSSLSPSSPTVSLTAKTTSTALFGKLWDRMELEEDEEHFWYVLNCVAGLEMDLLEQCKQRCGEMEDVTKFLVPTERKTRSHGAKRIVTETKVKYLGYVFAKLRLCEKTYEAIQGLDLCRSWMGTVNQKGYKKLPPAPVILNEDEIEKFGLEKEEEEDGEDSGAGDSGMPIPMLTEDGEEIIMDTQEADAKQAAEDRALQEEVTRTYGELRVDDMIKVTAQGKFLGEDGIVKRLKEGKILVRFYTYGTVYDHWLNPGDVRKMSDMEALDGLGGPVQPITQYDLDKAQQPNRNSGSDMRNTVDRSTRGSSRFMRQRRQDNTVRKFGSDMDAREAKKNADNWDWYKDQKRSDNDSGYSDGEWTFRGGNSRDDMDRRNNNGRNSNRNNGDGWQSGVRDGQVRGLSSRRQERRNDRQKNRADNRNVERALDGADDWSSFVSPAQSPASAKPSSRSRPSSGGDASSNDSSDFFESLMSDLSNDLDGDGRGRDNGGGARGRDGDGGGGSAGGGMNTNFNNRRFDDGNNQDDLFDDSDFFASLASEISDTESTQTDSSSNANTNIDGAANSDIGDSRDSNSDSDDDFFASLSSTVSESLNDGAGSGANGGVGDGEGAGAYDEAAFSLELENDVEDFLAGSSDPFTGSNGNDGITGGIDDFFDQLGDDFDFESEPTTTLGMEEAASRISQTLAEVEAQVGAQAKPEVSTGLLTAMDMNMDMETETGAEVAATSSTITRATGSSEKSAPSTGSSYSSLTVPALKDLLRERGMKVSGKKAELIERLQQS